MDKHFLLSDAEFLHQFEAAILDPALFSHEAHLILAWLYLKNHGVKKAVDKASAHLQRYTRALGAEDKFNTTLTVAAVRAVHHFMAKSTSKTFAGLILEFPRLKYNFKALMAAHYGFDIYHSKKAKTQYLVSCQP